MEGRVQKKKRKPINKGKIKEGKKEGRKKSG
jgi:hypothetical protein